MPNWVYNHISNYTKDLYDKYKADNDKSAIDFDKIIPEPEEIKNTISGSLPETARKIYHFRVQQEDGTFNQTGDPESYLRYSNHPLRDDIKILVQRTQEEVADLVIENPDKTLNELLEQESKEKYSMVKHFYDHYVKVFGNQRYKNCNMVQALENYINEEEKAFQERKDAPPSEFDNQDAYKQFSSLREYGKHLIELKEKYGYDNWYDWSCANWGTKWNACDAEYIEEEGTLHFDTAWSIPYPIIAKIAQDNPEAELDGCSEEEGGWFDEYKTKDGKVLITAKGEMEYSIDGKCEEKRTEIDPPEEHTYEEIKNIKLPWEK